MSNEENTTPDKETIEYTKKEASKARLLGNLAKKNLIGVREKVAFILNHFPHTRNSDVELAFKYWQSFHSQEVPGDTLHKEAFSKITRYTSITRARAKVQNEFGLYKADVHVANRRKNLSEEKKDEELSDKPDVPVIEFYFDESGKTGEYAAVGGLCSVDGMRSYRFTEHLRLWRKQNNVDFEFHFSKLSKQKVPIYLNFFKESIGFSDSLSFKISLVRNKNLSRSTDEIVSELYQHCIGRSIDYEIERGRVNLPRRVGVYFQARAVCDRFHTICPQSL